MSGKDWVVIAGYFVVGAVGVYMTMAPRRLFTRAEDPPRYRPEAVEYDSDHGRWLRTVMGPALIVLAIVLIVIRFL
jgi:hypothetical protein